jgi:hypothetical protein
VNLQRGADIDLRDRDDAEAQRLVAAVRAALPRVEWERPPGPFPDAPPDAIPVYHGLVGTEWSFAVGRFFECDSVGEARLEAEDLVMILPSELAAEAFHLAEAQIAKRRVAIIGIDSEVFEVLARDCGLQESRSESGATTTMIDRDKWEPRVEAMLQRGVMESSRKLDGPLLRARAGFKDSMFPRGGVFVPEESYWRVVFERVEGGWELVSVAWRNDLGDCV